MNSLPFSRRQFLIGLGAGGAVLAGGAGLGRWLEDMAPGDPSAAGATGEGPLVLVGLFGGNDGVNTLVPYADPAYQSARPTLGYKAGQVLTLDDGFGLNPQLTGFHSLWQSGRLAVVRGVGYPNPNLSHFESMDIWQTANPVDGTGTGWLGRWLDQTGADPMRAVSVGATLPPGLRGQDQSATAVVGTRITLPGDDGLQSAFAAMQAVGADRSGLAGAVAVSGQDLLSVKGQLEQFAAPSPSAPGGQVSASDLSGQLGIVAALINAGAPTRVYHVSLASFDTHADEKANHERLLKELDGAVTGFLQSIAAHPAGQRAVVMTYSEFGRRPAENASGGTDHGAASVLFVAGHQVKGGRFYGDEPSLTKLDPDGNPVFDVDFRSVYSTVLDRVVGADPAPVLGGKFPTLDFV